MSKIKLVSIIIPVYNHEKYILECLDAIKLSTYQNIELIIINDGSTDASHDVIKEWIKINYLPKIKYINQENQGVCKTLNKAIKISTGDYIALCASDDVLTKDSISSRVELLQANEDKLAIIGDAYLIDSDSKVVHKSAMIKLYNANYSKLKVSINNELIFNWSVVGPTLLVKKEIYDIFGSYDESLLVEDRDFYLRILAQDKLMFIDKNVAYYRIHLNNASRTSRKNKFRVFRDIAISNFKNRTSFSGLKKLFLSSYIIDIFITKCKFSYFSYYSLFLIRVLRYILIKLLYVR